jgi:glycine hydroxymethyltransferase
MTKTIAEISPQIAEIIEFEEARQSKCLRFIASENYASPAVREALSSVFTNKYGEGYAGRRYYQGQDGTDALETLVIEKAVKLFGYPYANVQALSGAPANLAVYNAFLEPNKGNKIMAMKLDHGGHLTHGSPVSVTGKWFEIEHYGVNSDDVLDMNEIREMALAFNPDILVCGYTAYPRAIDFEAFGKIAKEVGAISLADVSHIAGLIAAGVHPSPFPHCDIATFTTHKTLRGPRAAIILSQDEAMAKKIDESVFPGLQGGPHFNTIAAIGVALDEASTEGFKRYSAQVIANAKKIGALLQDKGYRVVSGGTDNHLLLIDTRKSKNVPGKRVAKAMEKVGLICNFNTVPNASDIQKPLAPDGIRMGTPAITTRGLVEKDMEKVAEFIDRAISNIQDGKIKSGMSTWKDDEVAETLKAEVEAFASTFPMFTYS